MFKKNKGVKNKKVKENSNAWIIVITLLAFFFSILFSFLSELVMPNVSLIFGILLVLTFIIIGVLCDMIGVAATTASMGPIHSMSAKKIKGAKVAVIFKQNASKVSSILNDVIGDVCGIISGSAGIYIATLISNEAHVNLFITTIIITALIASLTIGGKAIGKSFALEKGTEILFVFSKFISIFYNPKK